MSIGFTFIVSEVACGLMKLRWLFIVWDIELIDFNVRCTVLFHFLKCFDLAIMIERSPDHFIKLPLVASFETQLFSSLGHAFMAIVIL